MLVLFLVIEIILTFEAFVHTLSFLCSVFLQRTAESLTLDVGEDRLVLTTRSHVYHLDIFLPFNLISEDCGAQFDRNSKVMILFSSDETTGQWNLIEAQVLYEVILVIVYDTYIINIDLL